LRLISLVCFFFFCSVLLSLLLQVKREKLSKEKEKKATGPCLTGALPVVSAPNTQQRSTFIFKKLSTNSFACFLYTQHLGFSPKRLPSLNNKPTQMTHSSAAAASLSKNDSICLPFSFLSFFSSDTGTRKAFGMFRAVH
jgi:hypothetical protein